MSKARIVVKIKSKIFSSDFFVQNHTWTAEILLFILEFGEPEELALSNLRKEELTLVHQNPGVL